MAEGTSINLSQDSELLLLDVSPLSRGQQEHETTPKTSTEIISSVSWLSQPTLILVEGPGGSGKTNIMRRMEKVYKVGSTSSESRPVCVYIDLSDAKIQDNESVLIECIESANKGTLSMHMIFLFDALDQFVGKCRWLSTFYGIITSKVLKSSSLFIATRSAAVDNMYNKLKIDCHYIVQGFSPAGMKSYFEMFEDYEQISRLLIQHNNILPGICRLPFIGSQLVEILRAKRRSLTVTEIVYQIIVALIDREIRKIDPGHSNLLKSLYLFPREYFNYFAVMSRLAFLDLIHSSKLDSQESCLIFLSSFCINSSVGSLDDINTLNLMDYCDDDSVHANIRHKPYWFLTLEIRDFLAAFFLSQCPPLDQLFFLSVHAKSLIKKGYSGWLQFFYGLTVQREAEYNPTRMMMGSLNELVAYCLDLNEPMQLVIFIQCISETKEPNLWKKFVSKNANFLNISLSAGDVKMIAVDLVNLIDNSGCRDWVVEVSPKHSSIIEELKAYFATVTVELKIQVSLGDRIKLWPKVALAGGGANKPPQPTSTEGNAEQKILKIGILICRAIREILQRVFQLFVGYNLKGDCSSASYVSFFSCPCFKKALKDKVSFQPIVPYNFFTVKSASKRAGKKGTDPSTVAHMREEHADTAIELVILLYPSLSVLMFTLPSSEEKQEIHLFSGILKPDTSYERFMPSFVEELEEVVPCFSAEDLFPSKAEIVVSAIPRSGASVETVAPRIALPPTEEKHSSDTEHVTEGHATSGSTPKIATNSGLQPQPPLHYAEQVSDEQGPSLQVSSIQNQIVYASTFQQFSSATMQSTDPAVQPVQQQYSRRLATMKPGTVIFTANPTKIPLELTIPLPDMSMLMQSGGNGQIFAANILGVDLILKKTSYRSKEYAIITKLRHEHVIQLQAFVMGEENPVHKRRYFCYHILPQMSGDLARMVTDHKESLLMNLRQTYVDSPPLMGAIHSNTRLILSSVLQGLAYMHSLHIAHRDVKASNILLKLHCSCKNPILCSCADKMGVVICDFDAAAQLDVRNQLQPVSFSTSQTMQAIAPQYHSAAVGTNGFRAPECSMYTTANTPDAFSPGVSTKCDIFSFGLLCQRLMIGEEGPYRQRAIALLLLRYHQNMGCAEGRWGKSGLEIPESAVEKELKLQKLRSEMCWFEHSLDLVQCCLRLNPQERHPAHKLLLHPFFGGPTYEQHSATTTTTLSN